MHSRSSTGRPLAAELRKRLSDHRLGDAVVELGGCALDGLPAAERVVLAGARHAVLAAEPAGELDRRGTRELGPLFEQVAELPDDPRHRRAIGQLTPRSRPSQYGARSLNFWSFPVAVRASSDRNSIDVGHL